MRPSRQCHFFLISLQFPKCSLNVSLNPPLLGAATKKMAERLEWVDKRSSRIWRGGLEARFWRYIKGSGALQ